MRVGLDEAGDGHEDDDGDVQDGEDVVEPDHERTKPLLNNETSGFVHSSSDKLKYKDCLVAKLQSKV